MNTVSMRELQKHGREILERVAAGERLIVTRAGHPVAELGPVRRPPIETDVLLEQWRKLPAVDPVALRRDIDEVTNPVL